MKKDKLDEFMSELAKLTEEYGFEIGGCGCCGSPFIDDYEKGENIAEHMYYDEKEKKYVAHKQ